MKFSLDQIDIQIIHLLERNAFLNYREIGRILKRSPSVITERIQSLQKDQVILRYTAVVDYQKISPLFISFVLIRINDHNTVGLNSFKMQLSAFEEVIECEHVTGYYDFMVKVVVQHMPAYSHFIGNKLGLMPNLVEILSLPVLEEFKRDLNYPIFFRQSD